MASPERIPGTDALRSVAPAPELAAVGEEPSADGLALMGTARHGDALFAAFGALLRHFRRQPGLFIATQLPLCHDPRDRRRHVIPDLLVAHANWDRGESTYRLWEAPAPHFVLEIASRSTVDRDLGFKKREYERMGVLEYWQLDQSGELLPQPLLGHRLSGRRYRQLRPSGLVDGREAYYSAALGLELRSRGEGLELRLVFRDPRTGADILVGEDMDRALHAAEGAAKAAAQTAQSERSVRLTAEEAAESERSARLAAEGAAESERSARLAAEGAAESERSARRAAEERLAQAEEALRRAQDRAGSDLD